MVLDVRTAVRKGYCLPSAAWPQEWPVSMRLGGQLA